MMRIILSDILNGPLPEEFGYLIDCKAIGLELENYMRLTGPLPQTMGI